MRISFYLLLCFLLWSCQPVSDDSEGKRSEEGVDHTLYQLRISSDFSYQTQKKVIVKAELKSESSTQLKLYRDCCTQENLLADIQLSAERREIETWIPAYVTQITVVLIDDLGNLIEQQTIVLNGA